MQKQINNLSREIGNSGFADHHSLPTLLVLGKGERHGSLGGMIEIMLLKPH